MTQDHRERKYFVKPLSLGKCKFGYYEFDHLLNNYGVSRENIIVHIQNDIITIEWSPQEKDEYFDAEFQKSLRLLTDGKLEEAGLILEDMAFRSPKDPNVLYNLGMVYSEFHELDIAIDTPEQVRKYRSSVFQCLCCPGSSLWEAW